MRYMKEGDSFQVQGSGKNPYTIRMIGGVIDCSCPAWRNMGGGIDSRVCKHIKANVDPSCWPAAALAREGMSTSSKTATPTPSRSAPTPAVRLTPKGKVSTAVGGAVVKDTAPPILLAHTWEGEDPAGWWMSEKLDGVRAWWTGKHFVTRLGNVYKAPEWFTRSLPSLTLDGELWAGRGRFQETISIVRKDIPSDVEWAKITYMVFDIPVGSDTFESRQETLKGIHRHASSVHGRLTWNVLPQERCHGREHMEWMLEDVESKGGEGLMLRAFGSRYEEGRSNTLLKVKTFKDAEAVIVGHEPGRGKHKGRMGAVLVEMNGVKFKIGSGFSDAEREAPPPVGSRVTFKYQELTSGGIPRFPTFVAVRNYE